MGPINVIILTRNEEANLPGCLESLRGLNCEIFVVDSGSTDRTVEIATQHGARVVTHAFETHASQWNWALRNLPLRTDWTLCLDADHRLTPELRGEIRDLFTRDREDRQEGISGRGRREALEGVDGFYVKRQRIFRGKRIRYGGDYPKYQLKLVRHARAWSDEGELADHRFHVTGKSARLRSDLIEDNRNESDILRWAEKHLAYAERQAREEFLRLRVGMGWSVRPSFFGTPDQRTLWLKRLWYRMPLYVRPFLYFVYRYFLRLGFLDGKQGFLFHLLQGFWYRLMVDVVLDDLRRGDAQQEFLSVSTSARTTEGQDRIR